MRIAVHVAGTAGPVVRDATPGEEAALNASWSGQPAVKGFVFVGDSNTAVIYTPLAANYAHRLASAYGQSYVNSAVSGKTAAYFVPRLQETVFVHNPTNVMVLLGTNEAAAALLAGTPVATAVLAYIADMRSLISAVRAANKRIIVLSPPLSEEPAANVYLIAMRDALRELCFAQTVPMIDVMGQMQHFGTLGGTLLADWFIPSPLDHYHLSATGHAYIFDMIARSQIKAS